MRNKTLRVASVTAVAVLIAVVMVTSSSRRAKDDGDAKAATGTELLELKIVDGTTGAKDLKAEVEIVGQPQIPKSIQDERGEANFALPFQYTQRESDTARARSYSDTQIRITANGYKPLVANLNQFRAKETGSLPALQANMQLESNAAASSISASRRSESSTNSTRAPLSISEDPFSPPREATTAPKNKSADPFSS